jgi:amino acid transporter
LKGTGSVGLAMIYWFIGFLMSAAMLSIYLEYASYFPNRSGSEVVYLEQAYPRPRYLLPVTFAEYLYQINGHSPTAWELKGVAIACYTVVTLLCAFNTKFSYRLSNAVGFVKVATIVFIGVSTCHRTHPLLAHIILTATDNWSCCSWRTHSRQRPESKFP